MDAAPQDEEPRIVALDVPLLGLRSRSPMPPPGGHREVFRSEVWTAARGGAGPLHIHREQEERFEVLAGEITVRRGREQLVLNAGDTATVPPGTSHTFENTGDGEAHIVTEFRPALRVQEFFANLFGLINDGRTNDQGLPSPLQAAVLVQEFPREFFYPPFPPPPVFRALAAPLAAIGRRRGYRGSYPEYLAPLGVGR
jgi:quercetin dioxygenase-like cupin family protein